MQYTEIKMEGDSSNVRFLLQKQGKKLLYFVGINPSTANEEKADPTIKRVMGFAERNDSDGFAMINIYPQRSTNPRNLPAECDTALHQKNLEVIDRVFKNTEKPTIVLAFGNNIGTRHYLKECLKDIVKLLAPHKPKWKSVGEPTCLGNPRHPLYARYGQLQDFDIETYLKQI